MPENKYKTIEKLDGFGFILCICGHSVLAHGDGLSARGSVCLVPGCDCRRYRADRQVVEFDALKSEG
jgi:hypothetical protein